MSNSLTTPIYMLPDLVEIQRDSFRWFLEEGLIEELLSFSPITDYTGKMELHFLPDYKLKEPKYAVDEAKRRDSTYSVQMYVPTRLINKETGEIKEQQVFIGELPLMTDRGTFIINGAERVIVNQIVRSPGVYYKAELDSNGRKAFNASLIPNRGAWLKFETDANDLVWVRIDKTRKLSAVVLLKALGLSDNEVLDAFRHPEYFRKTIEKEGNYTEEEALLELYRKLRPGEPPTVSGGQQLLESRFFDPKRYDLGRVGRYKLNKKLRLNVPETTRILTPQDILASIDYLINLEFDIGTTDDIDHLGNRRVRSVGELLQNQVRVGFNRLERIIRERMTVSEADSLTPASLVNPKPLVAAIKEFFGSSQLSQFMDQTNPLAELTHKRRLSALGPGGLTRERAGFAVRDIHPSHYGRICPIETPEGPNAGLIGSLATHARVNAYGFIETPYRVVKDGRLSGEIAYLAADEEDEFRVAAGDVAVDENGYILSNPVTIRYRQDFGLAVPTEVDYVAVSPIQIVSVATSLIPFLEHDDANRALMGANMQRQAVPLLHPERPLVGTGLEGQAARDSGMVIVSDVTGEVTYVSGELIKVRGDEGSEYTYQLQKYQRSNQDTCLNQRPIVNIGDPVRGGQILADGSATEGGELALGQNILVAFMPWEGYNYEDAILISERLVYDDVFTSIHVEKFEIEARQTKLGPEEITREIPNVGEDSLRNLDERGIVRAGAWVEAGDILVGKVTPKGESDQPPEEKLLRAIFGEKARDVRDNSLRVPNGEKGRVVDVRVFTREQGDELPPGANMVVRVYVAQKRKIQVGDKMAGRHGNKGIISKILPKEDMPYLPDGRPVDIVLNPLGVPSRMNVGQVFETILGWAGACLNVRFKVTPFDEMYGKEASRHLVHDKLMEAREITGDSWVFTDVGKHIGKIQVFDGRTGEAFDRPVTVGQIYMMKLVHLVDDKIHARSTGPYSLVTQQPLGGKAQQGGQRFGEMEVWALEAFGAAYTLQELLTVKSDDMTGRNEALNAIVKGKAIPRPGIPESFKVLVRELQSLGLDVSVHKIETQLDGSSRDVEVDLMADVSNGRRTPSRPTYEQSSDMRELELSED
ncbi:MAG: DNA-directed RNA polymerase subunit beta [Gemmatimonadaceae bacterium]|nr:DNA-directed RNA polymerase subunit beta [Gloeobacterales cyanobacterium ES-bin-141]